MRVRGPNNVQLGRTVQTDPTFFCCASAITEQKKCCELLANNVASFFTGLKFALHLKHQQSFYGIQKK